jgi:hypothetical protein
LSSGFIDLDVEADISNGKLAAYLAAQGEILSKQYSEESMLIHCRLPRNSVGQLKKMHAKIRLHERKQKVPERLHGEEAPRTDDPKELTEDVA